jgi:hypothetical protein
MPSITDLKRAHATYERNEPRDVFYKVATRLIELAQEDDADISRAEALSVLLQSWNARYYVSQHHGRFPREHFKALDRLLKRHAERLDNYRVRPIENVTAEDERPISRIFADFEALLGPVGAAKALHLLAPRFFPLWDRDIAADAGCRLVKSGANAPRYLEFMKINRDEVVDLGGEARCGTDVLKRLDELNYCYARGWL